MKKQTNGLILLLSLFLIACHHESETPESNSVLSFQDSLSYKILKGRNRGITNLVFSPSGDHIAASGLDAKIQVWDIKDWKLIQELNHEAEIYDLAYSQDGSTLAATDGQGEIRLWNLKSGQVIWTHQLEEWALCLEFFKNESVVIGNQNGNIDFLSIVNGEILRSIDHKSSALNLAISPKHNYLAADIPVKLYDPESGELLKRTRAYSMCALAFHPNESILVSGEGSEGTRVLSLPDGEITQRLLMTAETFAFGPYGRSKIKVKMPVRAVAFNPKGDLLAISGPTKTIHIYSVVENTISQKPMMMYQGHQMTVTSLAFSPNGQFLASGSLDGIVRIWKQN